MNTLKTIQTLAKIGKVFSKIIFVCCIVGFCGCIVGIVSLALGAETFKLGGVTIHSMIENEAGLNLPTLYASMAVGLLFCAAEAVLCKFAEAYFKHELGRPEILNRIGDNIVVFDFIRDDIAGEIIASQIRKIRTNLAVEKGITLNVADGAKRLLKYKASGNLENGGRGIGNIVETYLINPLSCYIFDYGRFIELGPEKYNWSEYNEHDDLRNMAAESEYHPDYQQFFEKGFTFKNLTEALMSPGKKIVVINSHGGLLDYSNGHPVLTSEYHPGNTAKLQVGTGILTADIYDPRVDYELIGILKSNSNKELLEDIKWFFGINQDRKVILLPEFFEKLSE